MKPFTISCCLLAGLAGWWGMALSEQPRQADAASAKTPVAQAEPVAGGFILKDTVQKLRRTRSGSGEISRVAVLLSATPDDSLNDLESELYALPPSTARQFAFAMLAQRRALTQSDPSPPDAEPPVNAFRELEEELAEGYFFDSHAALRDWVSADPTIAADAILKMPPGHYRQDAVDHAAGVLSLTDPTQALEFVLKSGEPRPGPGFATAWAKLITGSPSTGGPAPSPEEFLRRMTRSQQDNLFSELADVIYSLDDSNINPNNPSRGSDFAAVACSVLQATERSPRMEALFDDLTYNNPRAAEEVLRFINSSGLDTPAARITMEILCAAEAEKMVGTGIDSNRAAVLATLYLDDDTLSLPANNTILNRSAPAIAATLASTGRLPEALQLLESLTDANFRHDATLSLLPAWMDADPAAARAAFQSLPLTAVERERWEHHPSFLLNPPP